MRACGICNRHLGERSGYTDLVRSQSGHFRVAQRCGACVSDLDGEASTRMLVTTVLGFSGAALLASLLSYLILGFL